MASTRLASLRELLFGKPKDPLDPKVFHQISLVAFLAWVGLGADGLSSSAYGPEEAYLALGQALLAAHETSAARRAASAAADHLRPTLGLDDRQTQIAQSLASNSSGTPP